MELFPLLVQSFSHLQNEAVTLPHESSRNATTAFLNGHDYWKCRFAPTADDATCPPKMFKPVYCLIILHYAILLKFLFAWIYYVHNISAK